MSREELLVLVLFCFSYLSELMADECPYRESKAMSFVLVFWYIHIEVISLYFLI